MKKSSVIAFIIALAFSACKQSTTAEMAIVGPTQLNVEKLNDSLDYQMDITSLSLSDLRILRNAPAALRGYPFRDSYLRSTYAATSWYDSLMWAFDGKIEENYENLTKKENETWRDAYYRFSEELKLVDYTQEELDFMKRIKEREDELLQNNFKAGEGMLVNVQNLINPGLLKTFDPMLQQRLGQNGFAIVPTQHRQIFHIYEQNDYHQFPSFVTTDLFLQLYHLYFDAMLREVEEAKLAKEAFQLIRDMRININYDWRSNANNEYGKLAHHNAQFLSIAERLLTGKGLANVDTNEPIVDEEVEKAMASKNTTSQFIGDYKKIEYPYSLFRPRGHYTRNDTLKRYFRAMMWLQNVPFGLDSEEQTAQALILANELNRNKDIRATYERLNNILTFLMGPSDDLSLLQVADVLKAQPLSVKQLIATPGEVEKIRKILDGMAEKQTRLRPKHQRTSRNKICLMPQRYQPDGEVLQEMVDYDSDETKRATPKGLDVFAAIGVSPAEKILLEELKEDKRWDGYKPALKQMKQRMDSIEWDKNVASQWVSTLRLLTEKDKGFPYFMLTDQWDKKALNAALSSWAELKHDAILYAKQPMGAECGGAGPPDPIVKGYVEPNVKFWKKAVTLLESTANVLNTYGLSTERLKTITTRIKEMAEFLVRTSEKELKGQMLSEEEYDQLKYIGASFENMSLELIRNANQNLWEWDDVQGPERNVALIADVYTANADNNPKKSILYEGVGNADEIYVIVEIGGYLYLMRGGVFSYRELTRPSGEQRMNDEEWQKKLETEPRLGVPVWMNEITVPVEEAPVDNDEVFYSSGC